MIIQKIRVENYRSHKHTELSLSKGVNLILGANGSGKSSILEAIGMVLFDVNDRTGKKTGKQFIKHGEKFANIEIEFLANDEREYLVRSPFTKSKSGVNAGKMSLQDLVTGEEYEGNLQEKLQELCGIKKEYQDIYDQIIIAKQNEFINIFKESGKVRENTFNKIFNTQIYTEMSDSNSFLKAAEDKYTREKEIIAAQRNTLSSNLENEEELLEQWRAEKEAEQKEEEEVRRIDKQKKDLEKALFLYRKSFQELEESKKQRANKAFVLLEGKKQLKGQVQEAKKIKLARSIVEKHQEAYENYQILWKDLLEKKEALSLLQRQEKEKQVLELENERVLWEVNKSKEELESLKKSLQENGEEQKNLIHDLEKSIANEEELREQEKSCKQLQRDLEMNSKERIQLEKQQFALHEKMDFREKQMAAKEKDWKAMDRESLISQLEDLEGARRVLEKKRQQKSLLEEKRNLLVEAREKLEEKFCPFLEEACSNVKNIDVKFYFSDKIKMLEEEKENLEQDIFSLCEKQRKEAILREEWSRAGYLASELEELRKLQLEEGFLLEKISLEKEKIVFAQKQLLFSASFEDEVSLQVALEEIHVRLSYLRVEEKKKHLETLKSFFLEKEQRQKQVQEQIQKKQEKVEENLSKIDESLGEKIAIATQELEDLGKKQESLREAYHQYVEHRQASEKLEESVAKIQATIQNIYQERDEMQRLLFQEEKLAKELAGILLEDLEKQKVEMESFLLEKSKALGIIKEKIVQLGKRLEKLRLEKEKIRAFKKQLQKLEVKLEKTKRIRAEIKTMGVKISKYMLESIAQAASYNFQKLTGRSEEISWSNEEKDKYAVYLLGEGTKTPFEHLSGGEQVVVAISLRESLTETFSNAKFMILDEPTNNLDHERKKLLAEYMAEMLGNLDQSIIVTHDDTFREMAERVIEF